MKYLDMLDGAFCELVRKAAKGNNQKGFVFLVDCIGKGNGDYIIQLCERLGHPNDMVKAVNVILNERNES